MIVVYLLGGGVYLEDHENNMEILCTREDHENKMFKNAQHLGYLEHDHIGGCYIDIMYQEDQ